MRFAKNCACFKVMLQTYLAAPDSTQMCSKFHYVHSKVLFQQRIRWKFFSRRSSIPYYAPECIWRQPISEDSKQVHRLIDDEKLQSSVFRGNDITKLVLNIQGEKRQDLIEIEAKCKAGPLLRCYQTYLIIESICWLNFNRFSISLDRQSFRWCCTN